MKKLISLLLILCLFITACDTKETTTDSKETVREEQKDSTSSNEDLSNVPVVVEKKEDVIKDDNQQNNNQTKPTELMITITYDQFLEKINNKESFVILFSQTTCGHCINFKSIMKDTLPKYNVSIYILEIDKLSQEILKQIEDKYNVKATPTIMNITKGLQDDSILGPNSADTLINFLKKHNYIKG